MRRVLNYCKRIFAKFLESCASIIRDEREMEFAPPSKFMRLGAGLSNRVRSAAISCFDVELYADPTVSEANVMSEKELSDLFGMGDKISSSDRKAQK